MNKSAMDEAMVTGGEKSDEGIVVKKLAGKAAMASEPAQELPVQALTQKAGTWREARNRGRKATNVDGNTCVQIEIGEPRSAKNRSRT